MNQEQEIIEISERLGLFYNGIQENPSGPGLFLVTDPKTKSTLAVLEGEKDLERALTLSLLNCRKMFHRARKSKK